jgi:hypothetical protein
VEATETHTTSIVSKVVGGIQWALTLSFLLSAIILVNLDGPIPFAKFSATELVFQLGLVLGFAAGYLWVGQTVTSVEEERSHRRQRVLYIFTLPVFGIVGNIFGLPALAGFFVAVGADAYDVLALIALTSPPLSYILVYVILGEQE